MLDRLKRKFILLTMVSLTILLAAIVAGMNIINYNSVISDADETLEMLSQNNGRMPRIIDEEMSEFMEESLGFNDEDVDAGELPQWMSKDRAEETRFFSVYVDETSGNACTYTAYLDKIYAVDEDTAIEYAEEAIDSGDTSGFINEFRYIITTSSNGLQITFMDCSRTMEQFKAFLLASIVMSLIGLAVIFIFVWYFAGRIVRPVAESYEKQKQFITDAGHEIKTPLTIIKANIDVMKMDIEDAEEEGNMDSISTDLNESLDDIVGQVDRLTTLTNNLVYLSRMEEAENTLTLTEVPISDIVSETADSFKAVAQERGKTLDIQVQPLLSMQGSNKELEKLVSILVENALKYSVEGGTIEVSLREEGRNIELEVSNKTPNPINPEDLEHVFERFYRADKSRNSAIGGHGIGLSMASAIVAAHRGKIRANNGDGSEFIVKATLPAE